MTGTTPRSTAPDRLVPRVEDNPADSDVAAVDDALAAFTVAAAGHDAPRPLAVFARRGRSIVAGVHGWTWGGCCELVSLWVSEPMRVAGSDGPCSQPRRTGHVRAGCHQVVLFTHALQTPKLYLDSGYDVVGEVEDNPAGGAVLVPQATTRSREPSSRASPPRHSGSVSGNAEATASVDACQASPLTRSGIRLMCATRFVLASGKATSRCHEGNFGTPIGQPRRAR